MNDKKRYFWIKLYKDFPDQDAIKILRSLENGYEYIFLYQQMLLKAMNSEDYSLMFNGRKPYTASLLASVLGHDENIVLEALDLFEDFGLIDRTAEDVIIMSDIENMIGSETKGAARKRKQRAKSKRENTESGTLSHKCPDDVPTMSHRDREEKEIEKNREENIAAEQVPAPEWGYVSHYVQDNYGVTDKEPRALYEYLQVNGWHDENGQIIEDWKTYFDSYYSGEIDPLK